MLMVNTVSMQMIAIGGLKPADGGRRGEGEERSSVSVKRLSELGWRRFLSHTLTMYSLNCLSLPHTALM